MAERFLDWYSRTRGAEWCLGLEGERYDWAMQRLAYELIEYVEANLPQPGQDHD